MILRYITTGKTNQSFSVMNTNNKKPIIALDCDGVLLDYHAAYAQIYQQTFGKELTAISPNAYRPTVRFGITMTPEERSQFKTVWDTHGWQAMPAHDGAVEACRLLSEAGYELVCVTQLRACFIEHRLENFRLHGFPIDRIISTKDNTSDENPKKEAIEQLNPIIFVDDHKIYFKGINGAQTKFVYIDLELEDHPCQYENAHYHAKYSSLLAFVKDFLQNQVTWIE